MSFLTIEKSRDLEKIKLTYFMKHHHLFCFKKSFLSHLNIFFYFKQKLIAEIICISLFYPLSFIAYLKYFIAKGLLPIYD
jgi:hypothetical protein